MRIYKKSATSVPKLKVRKEKKKKKQKKFLKYQNKLIKN